MKHLLFLALIVFLFSGIFACSDSGTQAQKVNQSKKTSGKILPLEEITPGAADSAIGRWQEKRAVINNFFVGIDAPQDTSFVAKGFHVPFADLDSILKIVGDTSQLFAMLAIQYDSSTTPPTPYICLILQAPDKNDVIRYYDFTLPCPSNCPN
ncbi:MAG: hypothetical protein H7246_06770 [Phycisphaerae bacterium]|nr:hypothetical protein [Saprospiraceae bacterium]